MLFAKFAKPVYFVYLLQFGNRSTREVVRLRERRQTLGGWGVEKLLDVWKPKSLLLGFYINRGATSKQRNKFLRKRYKTKGLTAILLRNKNCNISPRIVTKQGETPYFARRRVVEMIKI